VTAVPPGRRAATLGAGARVGGDATLA
jgi:hypothetical protein